MANHEPRREFAAKPPEAKQLVISWYEVTLIIASVALLLQLFPGFTSSIVKVCDIRDWGWRSFATASALWIVVCVGMKTWWDRKDQAD